MGLDWVAHDDQLRVLWRAVDEAEAALFAPAHLSETEIAERVAARDAAMDAADRYREDWLQRMRQIGFADLSALAPPFAAELLTRLRSSPSWTSGDSVLDGLGWNNQFRGNLLTHDVVGQSRIGNVGLFFESLGPLEAATKAEALDLVARALRGERRWRLFRFSSQRDKTVAILQEASLWLWFWSQQGCHIIASW